LADTRRLGPGRRRARTGRRPEGFARADAPDTGRAFPLALPPARPAGAGTADTAPAAAAAAEPAARRDAGASRRPGTAAQPVRQLRRRHGPALRSQRPHAARPPAAP